MYPILCKIRFESLHHVFRTRQIWIQIAFSLFLNWIIAPFLMVGFTVHPDSSLADSGHVAGVGVGVLA